jgi:hypothetical protein
MVTDGSFNLQGGMSEFTSAGLASGVQLTGTNHIPGLKTDHCSYRSELTGILGTVADSNLNTALVNFSG